MGCPEWPRRVKISDMSRFLFCLLGLFGLCGCCLTNSSEPARLSLVPLPQEVVWGAGRCPAALPETVVRDASVRPEGYVLEIDGSKGVLIRHADDAGLFYARTTLRQLRQGDAYPEVRISDWPEFPFRSVLIDDARLCYGKAGLKKIIDQMSEVKLNVLHWHFIEPQAWRLEIPVYPELTAKLSAGERYSAADVKEILDYAAARHVRVMPEIEMPGHNAVTRFYPEMGCEGCKRSGVCPSNPKTIAFYKAALDETCQLFPNEEIHFGGDEVSYANWKKCPRCQAKMKELGLGNEADLQAWFMGVMAAHLKAKGRTPVGWSDMLLTLTDGMHQNEKGYWTGYGIRRNLSKDIVINAWYGDWECAGGCGAVAANLGYKVIQYPSNHCYFDHAQGLQGDKYAYSYTSVLGLREAYDFDPRSDVRPDCRANVVGVGCANWSEKATDLAALEFKLWPRGFGTAEVGWTGPDRRNYADFAPRAKALAEIFRQRGINAATYE